MFRARDLAVWLCLGLLLFAGPALARKVEGIRLGQHTDRTRVVVDLDSPFSYRLERPDQNRALVYLQETSLAKGLPAVKPGIGRVAEVKASQAAGEVRLEIIFKGPSDVRSFTWAEANRLILDLKAAAAAMAAETKPEVKQEVALPKEAKISQTALSQLLAGGEAGWPENLPLGRPKEAVSGLTTAPTPPPETEAAPTTQGLTRPIAPADQAIAEPRPAVPAAAALAQAEALFREGQELFQKERYQEALSRFQEVESLAPGALASQKSLYYQADCLYYLNQLTGQPSFDQVENAYQKALGAWPDAADAARGLLRMGLVTFFNANQDRAKGYFNILIAEHPQSEEATEAKVYLGRILLEEGKTQPAVRLLREVIFDHPESPAVKEASWQLGKVLFEVGRYVEAEQRFSDIFKRWPDFYLEEPSILYYRGETAFRMDDLEEARRYLYWAYNIDPNLPNKDLVLARLGDTYKLEKKYRDAATLYNQAIRLFPDSDGALISQIRLAETKGLDDGQAERLAKVFGVETSGDAVETYRQIEEKHPDKPVAQLAMLKLGVWYYSEKNYEEAFKVLKDLLDRYPETEFYKDAVFALRQSFDKQFQALADSGQPLKLIEFYETNKGDLPREIQRRYTLALANAYLSANIYEMAQKLFEQAIVQGEKGPEPLLGLALSLYHNRQPAKAVEAMSRFLKLYPAHARGNELRLLLAQSLFDLGRFQESAKAYEDAALKSADSPEYWPAVTRWAESLVKTGNYNQAAQLLEKVLAQERGEPAIRRELFALLGDCLTSLNQPDKAATAYAEATTGLGVGEDAAGVYYRLAQAYFQAGEADQAREILNMLAQNGEPFWKKMAADRLILADVSAQLAERREVATP